MSLAVESRFAVRKTLMLCAAALLSYSTIGCQYYKVTDNSTGYEYYTRQWVWEHPSPAADGTVKVTDLTDGKTRSIAASDIEREQITYQKATLAVGYQ